MDNRQIIAIVANTTWNIYNFRMGLIKALKERGYEVVVIASPDEFADKIIKNGIRLIPLNYLNRKGKNPIHDLKLLREFWSIYRKEKFSLIFHFTIKPNIYGNIAAHHAGITTISTITGLGYTFLNGSTINHVVRWLYKRALKNCGFVVFQNEDDRNYFLNNLLPKKNKAILIPGSGVDTEYFSQRKTLNGEQSKLVFLFIGRLLTDKGIKEFIDAAKQIALQTAKAEFWILGDIDPDNPASITSLELADLLKMKGIRHLGFSGSIKPVINQADVIVLPSYREGMPKAILEGMAMYKPIITTNVSGCRDTVEHGRNGFLVEAKNSNALAETFIKMIALTNEERQAMGEASRQKVVNEFDEKLVLPKYLDLVSKINTSKNGILL